VRNPVRLVDGFAQLFECVIRAEDGQIEGVAQVVGRVESQLKTQLWNKKLFSKFDHKIKKYSKTLRFNDYYVLVEINQLFVVQEFVGIGDVSRHGIGFALGAHSRFIVHPLEFIDNFRDL
jgi:hypothetical protein